MTMYDSDTCSMGKEVLGEIFCTTVVSCISVFLPLRLLFPFLTSFLCSFLFLRIKETKLNILPLNTVKENQIYVVLSHTFVAISFFLLPFFPDLCILSSQLE
jgi:hypothetical protein